MLGASCQPARGDPLGPGTPELAFSDNPLICRPASAWQLQTGKHPAKFYQGI